MEEAARTRKGVQVAGVGIVANLFLLSLKFGVGIAIGSLSLLADALDTFGDVLMACVTLFGFKIGARKADAEHPYGHQRAEDIAALTVAVLLTVVSFQVIVEAVKRLIDPGPGRFSYWAVAVVGLSILVKIALARYTRRKGRLLESRALVGAAWNYLADVIAGVLVLVAIVGRYYGIYWLDPVMALAISLLVIRVGVKLFLGASDHLMGRGLDPLARKEIEELVCSQPGVMGCSDIDVHWYGRKRHINLSIYVPSDMSLDEARGVSERVQKALMVRHANWEPSIDVIPADEMPPGAVRNPAGTNSGV